jgi:hypothetical protein
LRPEFQAFGRELEIKRSITRPSSTFGISETALGDISGPENTLWTSSGERIFKFLTACSELLKKFPSKDTDRAKYGHSTQRTAPRSQRSWPGRCDDFARNKDCFQGMGTRTIERSTCNTSHQQFTIPNLAQFLRTCLRYSSFPPARLHPPNAP